MGLFSKDDRITIKVPNMSCHHCEMRITEILKDMPGVKRIKADAASKTAIVTIDTKTPPDIQKLLSALEEGGYKGELAS